MSEIDDIFASKGKRKAKQIDIDSKDQEQEPVIPKKKKKKSKKDAATAQVAEPEKASSKKRPPPETIVDPSQAIASVPKRQKTGTEKPGEKSKTSKKEGDKQFKDSRGTSNRMSHPRFLSTFSNCRLRSHH